MLKKQAPKRRTRAEILADAAAEEQDTELERPNPVYVRYVQSRQGTSLGVPEEIISAGVMSVFAGEQGSGSKGPSMVGRMVEEVA